MNSEVTEIPYGVKGMTVIAWIYKVSGDFEDDDEGLRFKVCSRSKMVGNFSLIIRINGTLVVSLIDFNNLFLDNDWECISNENQKIHKKLAKQ